MGEGSKKAVHPMQRTLITKFTRRNPRCLLLRRSNWIGMHLHMAAATAVAMPTRGIGVYTGQPCTGRCWVLWSIQKALAHRHKRWEQWGRCTMNSRVGRIDRESYANGQIDRRRREQTGRSEIRKLFDSDNTVAKYLTLRISLLLRDPSQSGIRDAVVLT